MSESSSKPSKNRRIKEKVSKIVNRSAIIEFPSMTWLPKSRRQLITTIKFIRA